MKKIIFGIFAHPDDEAFGPAGTLLLETRAGTELHLITLTNGDAGVNLDDHDDLGRVRLEEWEQAGDLLGAATMTALGYKDGQLNNRDMITIGDKLIQTIGATLEKAPADAVVEFMTLDLNGYTGHIDHIVAARAACFAFYRLKKTDDRLHRIRFACLPAKLVPSAKTDWIFAEAGRQPQEIDEIIDARAARHDIVDVMIIHRSQRQDFDATMRQQGKDLGLNYFIVRE
jgi:LmbE family N-acetylglucosaminyl deacetylase